MLRNAVLAGALALAACASAQGQEASRGVIVRADAGADISFGVGEGVRLSSRGNAAVGQMRLIEHPGYRTPLHVHRHTDESFLVLEGELTVFVNGEQTVLRAGDYAFIPRGAPHAQGNASEADSVTLFTASPGDFIGFFDAREEIARETPPGHPDYGPRLMALGERFDIEVVGPAPF